MAGGCRLPESKAATGLDDMVAPRYNDARDMLRPEGYRQWVFVGASLGLRYAEDGEPEEGPGSFHNVYIQPEAYADFMDNGIFPEKTILAMETYETGTREPKAELTGGYFEETLSGFSVAVKDSERFDETWGYVSFGDGATATPFPKERCYDCHAEHAAVDNVFTQFYPILRR
jgi:hypothetical protein